MRVFGLPGAIGRVSKLGYRQLSHDARERLRYVSCFRSLREQGMSSIEASQAMGIPKATLYRWEKRLEEEGLKGMEEKSRRPKRTRKPTWSPELSQAVLGLREQYPRWGKDKLVVLLRREGWEVSTSMVGRIISDLKARRVLKEPPRSYISARRRQQPRPYAIRKPKEYEIRDPGDLVEVDTLNVRPLPGVEIKLFVLPPRSPELNGHVERAQRTHTEEFYEVYLGDTDLKTLNPALVDWERVYNHIRPHQALHWKTPASSADRLPSHLFQ